MKQPVMCGSLVMLIGAGVLVGQTSRNHGFSVETRAGSPAATKTTATPWKATVVSRAGTRQYEVSATIPYDVGFPAVLPSDDGGCVVIRSFEGTAEFYGPAGARVQTITLLGTSPEYERNFFCSVAADRAAFAVSEPGAPRAITVLSGMDGIILWRKDLAGSRAGSVFLSDSGRFVVACSYRERGLPEPSTEVFDAGGNLVKRIDGLFRVADVQERRRILALADKGRVRVLPLDGSAAEKEWSGGRTNHLVTGLRFAGPFLALIVEEVQVSAGGASYRNPLLVLLDGAAKPVRRSGLRGTSARASSLRVEGETVRLVASYGRKEIRVPLPR